MIYFWVILILSIGQDLGDGFISTELDPNCIVVSGGQIWTTDVKLNLSEDLGKVLENVQDVYGVKSPKSANKSRRK
jgi:hypothetical protein